MSISLGIVTIKLRLNNCFPRYNLMANRILLLLTMASWSNGNSSSKILVETAGQHILQSLYLISFLFVMNQLFQLEQGKGSRFCSSLSPICTLCMQL